MLKANDLRKKIQRKIDRLSDDKLKDILKYLRKLEKVNDNKEEILALAGSWENIDQNLIDDLTINLNKNRNKGKRDYE